MFRTALLIALCFIFMSAPSAGAQQREMIDLAKTYCRNFDYDEEKALAELLEEVRRFERLIPNVPPEEESYLSREYDAIMVNFEDKRQRRERFGFVSSRPWYRVWSVRRDINKVEVALKKVIETPKGWGTDYESKEAEKLRQAIAASDVVAHYVSGVGEFLSNAELGKVKVVSLSGEQIQRFSFHTYILPSTLSMYMQCKLAKIMGPQPLFPNARQ
jgi:hypothetical protein